VLLGKYGAYGPWLSQGMAEGGLTFMREVVVANVQGLDRLLNYVFMPVSPVLPRAIAFVTVCMLALVGLVVLVRRAPVSALFLMAYALVILLWPFEPDRFVLALWPLLTLCGLSGIVAIWRWRPEMLAPRAFAWRPSGLRPQSPSGPRPTACAAIGTSGGRRCSAMSVAARSRSPSGSRPAPIHPMC
jgi:hypothetical protein